MGKEDSITSNMKKGEIIFCNLYLKRKNGLVIQLKECVFSKPYEKERNVLEYNNANDRVLINKTNLKEDLIIESIEIIKSVGFKHKGNAFSEVKKNDNNIRNAIGGYD